MSARSRYQLSSYYHQASWPELIPPTIRQRTWYASNHAQYVSDPSSSLKLTVPGLSNIPADLIIDYLSFSCYR